MVRIQIIAGIFLFWIMGAAAAEGQSVVLKVVAVNPSTEESQKATMKVPLPKEVKPEDVLYKDDLQIKYDTEQGSYFAYGEYELSPSEMVEKEIEIRDIWIITNQEIGSLRSEASQLWGLLKNTTFAERIGFLKESIGSKLDQIAANQLNSPANPELHISTYRENAKILEAVKNDLAVARSLLSQAGPLARMTVVWRLMIGIILFLGVFGASFYFIWQKQVKVIGSFTEQTAATEQKDATAPIQPTSHSVGTEKKTEPVDIEKIMGQKKED
jgi:hypothetical protein